VTDLALDWLDRVAPRGKPWFLFLNYLDPHSPYRPPSSEREAFARGIDPDGVPFESENVNSGGVPLTAEMRTAIGALYDGEVHAADAALGRLLDELERRGYSNGNLFVIVTSDHGESLGEHGFIGHLLGMPDPVLHVPLLITGPGIEAGEIATPVQTVQIRATVRALMDMPQHPQLAPPLPPWGVGPPLLIAEHPEPTWYLENLRTFNAKTDDRAWRHNWVAVERDGVKVIFDDHGNGATYRLADDPSESHPEPLDAGSTLVEAYRAWNTTGWSPMGGRLSDETRRALESLGYIR
jgi:arylsulfatase A-like enzyme